MESTIFTLRLNADTKKLDQLANATHRSKSFLAVEAISRYLELDVWQISEIELFITEGNAGDFASSEQPSKLINKYAA
jgi:RHH-type rel operon transcriptional repressor/antitoxin RelB